MCFIRNRPISSDTLTYLRQSTWASGVCIVEIESPRINQHGLKLPLSPSAGITDMHHHGKVK